MVCVCDGEGLSMQALQLMETAGFTVNGILHIGANDGQERYHYIASGASPCIYVEPIDAIFALLTEHLRSFPGHIAFQAVCADTQGEVIDFNIANNGGLSSSMLALGAHAEFHPTISYTSSQRITTTTVDTIIKDLKICTIPNLLVVDTQGTELNVLKGALHTLSVIEGAFVEVSEEPLYEGGCTHEEITRFLKPVGLQMRWMALNAHGHGDAFYCRTRVPPSDLPAYNGNHARGKSASQSSRSIWSTPDDPQGAVNGQKTGTFGFHTDEEDEPWWQLDLGERMALHEIRIFNRVDAERQRSRNLQVLLSDDCASWTLIYDQGGYTFNGVNSRPLRVILKGETARYVRLQLNERNFLHLDEVEVY